MINDFKYATVYETSIADQYFRDRIRCLRLTSRHVLQGTYTRQSLVAAKDARLNARERTLQWRSCGESRRRLYRVSRLRSTGRLRFACDSRDKCIAVEAKAWQITWVFEMLWIDNSRNVSWELAWSKWFDKYNNVDTRILHLLRVFTLDVRLALVRLMFDINLDIVFMRIFRLWTMFANLLMATVTYQEFHLTKNSHVTQILHRARKNRLRRKVDLVGYFR